MSARFDRIAQRWLLRVTVLAIITVAIWESLYSQRSRKEAYTNLDEPKVIEEDPDVLKHVAGGAILQAGKDLNDAKDAESARRKNTVVVASMKKENTSWFDSVLQDWEKNIYVVDDIKAEFTVPKNKGREGMVYLTYIIDNYDDLPDVTLFLHSTRYQWHNDDPFYDGVPILNNLRVARIVDEGYANLRCCWTLGCPNELRLTGDHLPASTEAHFGPAFQVLFPGEPVPTEVGVACCAQFGVTASQIRQRPAKDYVRYRDWLSTTKLSDDISGRIMEYSWHIIFGKPAVHCPPAPECYCKTFGLCNLKCDEETCKGRYILPPYSSLPDNWPNDIPLGQGWPEPGWTEKAEQEEEEKDEVQRRMPKPIRRINRHH